MMVRGSYRQIGASQLVQVSHSSGNDDACYLADFHPEGHDAAADCVCLTRRLLEHGKGARFGQISPMYVLGDVLRREAATALAKACLLPLWSKQDCEYRSDGDP